MTNTPPQTRHALLETLAAHPDGIRRIDLCRLSGQSNNAVATGLTALRAAGLAGAAISKTGFTVWAAATHIAAISEAATSERLRIHAVLAQQRADRIEARNQAGKVRAADVAMKVRKLSESDAACEAFAQPSIHLLVLAGQWRPTKITGPTSIFNWGTQ
jgi:hypothetical protein